MWPRPGQSGYFIMIQIILFYENLEFKAMMIVIHGPWVLPKKEYGEVKAEEAMAWRHIVEVTCCRVMAILLLKPWKKLQTALQNMLAEGQDTGASSTDSALPKPEAPTSIIQNYTLLFLVGSVALETCLGEARQRCLTCLWARLNCLLPVVASEIVCDAGYDVGCSARTTAKC